MGRAALFPFLLLVFLTVQISFWWQVRHVRPVLEILPAPPTEAVANAMALGDTQFLFRALAIRLQHAGDTFGRISPLKHYDYETLSGWFALLDGMDRTSDLMPTLAAYYYSQTQKTEDVRYMVDYLHAHAMKAPEDKWWWLVQAAYLANHRMGDKALALQVTQPLLEIESAPLWARQMPAFIPEQRGEVAEALAIMEGIRQNVDTLRQDELNFMRYFIEERLGALEKQLEEQGVLSE
mgnify:CR=1 FL=1